MPIPQHDGPLLSWRLLAAAYDTMARAGVPDEAYTSDVLALARRVSETHELAPWRLYIALLEQARGWFPADDAFVKAWELFDGSVPEVAAVAAPSLNVTEFCRFVVEAMDAAVFPELTFRVQPVTENVVAMDVGMPAHFPDGTAWFLASIGALRTLPRHLGLPAAQVEAEIDSHHALFRLKVSSAQAAETLPTSEQARASAVAELVGILRNDVRRALALQERGRSASERLSQLAQEWDLTPRQREVLSGICRGLANKEIAEELHCSVKTVEVHVTAILRKAGFDARAQLLARFGE